MKQKASTKRINLIFAAMLCLALGISVLVFFLGDRINASASKLVEKELPAYAEFQQLVFQLTDQERCLYEYYATFERAFFTECFDEAGDKANDILLAMQQHFGSTEALAVIHATVAEIQQLARDFDQNMQNRLTTGTDWDLARDQLARLSQLRKDFTPHIQALTNQVQRNITEGLHLTRTSLSSIRFSVIVYVAITLLIAAIVARAIKVYLHYANANQRLSLFPKRNPNPILSLNQQNKVTYANPATYRVMSQSHKEHAEDLLPIDLEEHQQAVIEFGQHFTRFEYQLENRSFECELHYLEDQQEWDLHLTDISGKKEIERKLQFQAYHHPKTGIANLYRFQEDLSNFCTGKPPFILGLLELRSYSQLLSGHNMNIAQQVINELANLLTRISRTYPDELMIYHIGDKNFAVILFAPLSQEKVAQLTDNLTSRLRDHSLLQQYQVELDYGFAAFPEHSHTNQDLLKYARIALDHAASNDACFHIFDRSLGETIQHQQELIQDMRQALHNQDFELYFQPQFAIESETITGAELLLRWKREDQWVSPAEFIPLAERSGFILQLGEWVLKTACEKGKALLDQGFNDLVFAINISPKQFIQPDFVVQVEEALAHSGLPAENLELELTEGVILYNERDTITAMTKLKKMGVKLAIDDFGTGYSSLSYLAQFPIDKLKIDQSFVHGMLTDSARASIVRTIINLGINLNLTVIAEGVEEEDQCMALKKMGCQEIQGYWFSKPLDEGYFSYFMQQSCGKSGVL